MGDNARVVIKKIYFGRAALFGLLSGVVAGILAEIIGLIAFLFFDLPNRWNIWMFENLGVSSEVTVMTALAFLVFILVFIKVIICTLIYNIVSKIHAPIHLHLEENAEVSIAESKIISVA